MADYMLQLSEIKDNISFIELEKSPYTLEEQSQMIGIDFRMLKDKPNWYFVNDNWYYFKAIGDLQVLINEMLGVKLATSMVLPTVNYKFAKISKGKYTFYGIISPSFIENNKTYLRANELGLKYNCGHKKLKKLRKLCGSDDNYNKLIEQLNKLSLLDFYMSQLDRVPNNMFFVADESGLNLSKLFDYSASFNTFGESNFYSYFPNVETYYSHYHEENKENFNYICSNYLFSLTYPSKETIKIFSTISLQDSLLKLYNFNLVDSIHEIEEDIHYKVPNGVIKHYENEQREKRLIIERMAK